MKRRSLGLMLGLIMLGAAGVWFGYRLNTYRTTAALYLPATPALADRPAVFVDNLAAAEVSARSLLHAKKGLIELSRLYHANGFYAEAVACYEGLGRMEPTNARWPHLLASIAANSGRLDEALPLREKTVGLAPDYIPARLRLGDIFLKTNRVADAAKTYAEVLRRVPGEPYALLGLARCDLITNDWVEARDHLQQALAQHPDFIGALSLLVTVSEQLGDQAAAESYRTAMGSGIFSDLPDPWLDELADVCFDPYLLTVAASVANFAGNRPTALVLIDRAIALSPDNSSYRRQAAQYFLEAQNFGAAKDQMEKAVAINPTDSDCWLRYLDALRGLGQTQAVANAIVTGLSHCPQSSSLHLEYARWLKSVNRMDEAIAEFRYGYQLRPSEASPLVELASAYFSVGKNGDAVDALNLALQRQPDHVMALATLAFYAISSNDEVGARGRWEQIRRQTKTPAAIVAKIKQAFQQQFGRSLP